MLIYYGFRNGINYNILRKKLVVLKVVGFFLFFVNINLNKIYL